MYAVHTALSQALLHSVAEGTGLTGDKEYMQQLDQARRRAAAVKCYIVS